MSVKNYARTIGIFTSNSYEEQQPAACQILLSELSALGFNVVKVVITDKHWQVITGNNKVKEWRLKLSAENGLVLVPKKLMGQGEIKIDLVLPIDPSIAQNISALADNFGAGVINHSSRALALVSEPSISSDLLNLFGVKQLPYFHFSLTEWRSHRELLIEHIDKNLSWPVRVTVSGNPVADCTVETFEGLEKALKSIKAGFVNVQAIPEGSRLVVSVIGNYNESKDFLATAIETNSGKQIIIQGMVATKIQDTITKIIMGFKLSGVVELEFVANNDDVWLSSLDIMPLEFSRNRWEDSNVNFSQVLKELIRLADTNGIR